MNGQPIKARFGTQDKKAEAWMNGTMAEEDALQIKTGNFFRNLMRKIDEERYGFEKQGATIDMWMARVFGYGSKAIGSSARYYFAERETTKLASELGWEPQVNFKDGIHKITKLPITDSWVKGYFMAVPSPHHTYVDGVPVCSFINNPSIYNGSVRLDWSNPHFGYFDGDKN
jgi:hypothetical protein